MSPRYLCGKYRSRLHPWSQKCTCQFLRETERVKSNCTRPVSSASRGNNEVDHGVCLKAEFQRHTVLSNENGKFYTTMIYPCYSRSVCFSKESPAWWRFGLCSSPGVQVRVPSCPNDVTLCSCAIFKCDVADVNKYIRIGFRASNAFLLNVSNHIVKIFHNISGPTV